MSSSFPDPKATEKKPRWRSIAAEQLESIVSVLPTAALVLIFGYLFYHLLRSHMLFPKANGLYSGGSTWGDLAWHLSMISNFVERGLNAVSQDPIYPGIKLSYPFLPDLLSAAFVRCGVNLQNSLILPSLAANVVSVAMMYLLARKLIGGRLGAMFVPFMFFFNGSIVGLYYLWQDYRKAGTTLLAFMRDLPVDYAHLQNQNIHFSNVISDYVLPQRAFVFGLLAGMGTVYYLWLYWERSELKYLLYAGIILSLMPLIHFHSFIAILLASGCLFLIELIEKHKTLKSVAVHWCLFATLIVVVAVPQLLWILPAGGTRFLRISLGWMKGSDPWWWFWLKNLSPHIFIFALAFYVARPKLRSFYLAFCGIFVLTNIVRFQPHDYDNMKLMLWWFLVSCVMVGVLFQELWRRYSRQGLLAALLLCVALVSVGGISVYRELGLSWMLFSSEDVALARYLKDRTSKNALFLTSDKHNNPVACLAGRRILMGYRGWLWTHGIDYRQRERDVLDIYTGSPRSLKLLQQYSINYVLLETDKIADLGSQPVFFEEHFRVVYRSPNYTVFRIE